MIGWIIGAVIVGAAIFEIRRQIPPEDPEIIEARKRYGKSGDSK